MSETPAKPTPLPWPFPSWGYDEHGEYVMQSKPLPVPRQSKAEQHQALIDEVGESPV